MAQPIICSIDGVERATWLMGDLESGDQYALCDSCVMGWMLAKLDVDLTPEGKAHVVSMWAPAPKTPAAEGGSAGDASKSRPGRPGRRRRAGDDPQSVVTALQAAEGATAAQAAPETPAAGGEPAAADAS